MEVIISSVDIKKADGTKTRFDFKYDNGLPYKPTVIPDCELNGYRNENNEIDSIEISCSIDSEDEKKFKNNYNCSFVHFLKNNKLNEYWFEFKHCYVVFSNNELIIYDYFQKNRLGIEILKKQFVK